jgi:hypothetical protein
VGSLQPNGAAASRRDVSWTWRPAPAVRQYPRRFIQSMKRIAKVTHMQNMPLAANGSANKHTKHIAVLKHCHITSDSERRECQLSALPGMPMAAQTAAVQARNEVRPGALPGVHDQRPHAGRHCAPSEAGGLHCSHDPVRALAGLRHCQSQAACATPALQYDAN